ncbi:unnamed protein product [Calypogeia fissa]
MEKGSSKGRQKVRFAPPEYFLPRRPLHVSIAVNGACILAGLGVGMLIEKWISEKVKEDGGYVTIGSKKEEVSEKVTAAPLQQST